MSGGVLNLASLVGETFWSNKSAYEAAECHFANGGTLVNVAVASNSVKEGSLADEIARARQHIQKSLQCEDKLSKASEKTGATSSPVSQQLASLVAENKQLKSDIEKLQAQFLKLENRVAGLEKSCSSVSAPLSDHTVEASKPTSVKKDDDGEDDDVDLFGSDNESGEDEREKRHQERLKAYEEKKSKKPAVIAKSNIILDVKPWDDETDMKAMEEKVRSIRIDGLVWGASKLVPLAYGIHKLQISCVVEDDIVSVDMLQEDIQNFEDLVQSVDIAAFNKV